MENNKIIDNPQVLTDAQVEALYNEVAHDFIANKIKEEFKKFNNDPELMEKLANNGISGDDINVELGDDDTKRMREIFNNIINR
jgi:FKBP-type peptidyl-prolyl cis-trans isomerase (trigger factor)